MTSTQNFLPGDFSSPPRRIWGAMLAWFVLALGLYYWANGAHSLWDRDEPRYAVATREMLVEGDWIVPHFNGGYRFDKPVLIYWLMSVPMRLMGVNEFSARAVSGAAGALTVALVFLLALRMGCTRRGADLAALIALLSPLLLVISKASTTDAVLVLTVVAALYLHWQQRTKGFSWLRHGLFWVILALSALLKGPPGLMVVATAILADRGWTAWERRKRRIGAAAGDLQAASDGEFSALGNACGSDSNPVSRGCAALRTLIGLLIFLAVGLPWAWAAWVSTEGAFFQVAIGRHVIERATSSLESHRGPIVYYLPVLLAGMFPFTLWMPAMGRWVWRRRNHPALRLLICWVVPGFVIFSLAKTKLPHYVAPLIPALAVMGGLAVSMPGKSPGRKGKDDPVNSEAADGDFLGAGRVLWRMGAVCAALIGVGGGLALPVAVELAPFPQIRIPVLIIALLMIGVGLGMGHYGWRMRSRPALGIGVAGFLAILLIGFTWGIPALEPLRPSKVLAHWLHEKAPPGARLLAVEYQEPSLVFYWGDKVVMLGKSEQEEGFRLLLDTETPTALVIPEGRWYRWLGAFEPPLPPEVGVRYQNNFYSFQKGHWTRLCLITNWDPALPR